ncbi:MAG: nicotinate phosphoribosyltransferase [Synergistaceae bacterium]|nr:nicotinate phosphoribosyltransferase [Synergistaceae bacterium]
MFSNFEDVEKFNVPNERLKSATHEEIISGATTDVYFVKIRGVLEKIGRLNVLVAAEIFARSKGVFAGLQEVKTILTQKNLQVEAIAEGESFSAAEVIMTIRGSYADFGIYETTILGILASSCGWATRARECVEAAGGKSVLSFGARHLHPAVSSVMDYIAVKFGGCSGASSILGAKLCGLMPSGTIPHAAVLLTGDTLELARVYDEVLPMGESRTFLVDTFKDEAEETLRLADALGDKLNAVRLDTPGERGGVTAGLVREVRSRLDQAGFNAVKIVVSGGLDPDRIRLLVDAGADIFGVGSFISHAEPIDMTMDIKEIEGVNIAKRGRIPGLRSNSRLNKVSL